ncbi:MAG: LPS export ABC transporter periplasmic protein LptC [Nitrosomonadales bacterium]|nr:LPS export ABC transporter periplasmic protein LptC [Nitrosomonadales bacterium]
MTRRLYSWLPLAPLLLLLGGTYWLNQQIQPLPPKPDDSKRHDPDYIVSNFSATTLDKQGSPHHTLSARQMLHYPDDDSLHLERPQLVSLHQGTPTLITHAQTGLVSHKGDEVFLRGDVYVVRKSTNELSERTFTTTYLHVVPDQDRADTDRPVIIADAHNLIRAAGMEMDNKAQTVKLTQVRSQHEPAR